MDRIKIEVETHGRTTVATVILDDVVLARGTALRSKADVACELVGEWIAAGRAIQAWGLQVEAAGHAACVTKEEADRVARVMDARAKEREARKGK